MRRTGKEWPRRSPPKSSPRAIGGDGFRFEPLSEVTLKGVDEPMTLYRVESAATAT